MKILISVLFLMMTACGDDNAEPLDSDVSIEGDYYDGLGTFNGEDVLFLFVSQFPADDSISVSFTTAQTSMTCRYYFYNDVNGVKTFVSIPNDFAEIRIQGNELIFDSEDGMETDPCKKIKSTRSFIRG